MIPRESWVRSFEAREPAVSRSFFIPYFLALSVFSLMTCSFLVCLLLSLWWRQGFLSTSKGPGVLHTSPCCSAGGSALSFFGI